MTEKELMEIPKKAKERYEELSHKNWDWSSFYNGWLECYGSLIPTIRTDNSEVIARLEKEIRQHKEAVLTFMTERNDLQADNDRLHNTLKDIKPTIYALHKIASDSAAGLSPVFFGRV